jgi:hypothetical protein
MNLVLIIAWNWSKGVEKIWWFMVYYIFFPCILSETSSWALFCWSVLKKRERVLIRHKSPEQGLDMKSLIVHIISPRHSCGERRSSNFSVGWQIFWTYWHGSGEFVSPQTKDQPKAGWSEIWRINKSHVSQLFPKAFRKGCGQAFKCVKLKL